MRIITGAEKVKDERTYKIIGVEIKTLSQLSRTEEAQILNYLKATQQKTGLLISFGTKSLEYKKIRQYFLNNYLIRVICG